MEVLFSAEIEMRLHQMALANGKEPQQLVRDSVEHMLDHQPRFVADVQLGIAQADRGEMVDHEEVCERKILNIWYGAQDWR